MKKRLSVIILAFSVSLVLIVSLSFFSIKRVDALIDFSNKADNINFNLKKLYNLHGFVKDLDRAERGYMLTRDTAYSNGLLRITDSLETNMAQMKELAGDSLSLQRDLLILRSMLALRMSIIKQNIAYVDSAQTSTPSQYYFEGRKTMQDCTKKLRDIERNQNMLYYVAYKSEHFYMQVASSTLKYLLTIFLIVTVGLFVMMLLEFRRRIGYQDELHARISELKQSHMELEQIAYAASHDLREPLRKIQVFTNRLLWLKKDSIDEESKNTMERINTYTTSMQELIEDLVYLTSLTKEGNDLEWVDLNKSLSMVLSELEYKIQLHNAKIAYDTLPKIKGYTNQIGILFRCIIDVSLACKQPGKMLSVHIKNEIANGNELADFSLNISDKKYHVIIFSDNGSGFENIYTDKMFQIFQTLSSRFSSYDGKGVSLAICHRIMSNHEGYILLKNNKDHGAVFKLYFPIIE
jgi:signal transduction histidine kinase